MKERVRLTTDPECYEKHSESLEPGLFMRQH